MLGLALLLGLGGGFALLAVAGARRTASAFERLEMATSASDVLVNPDNQDALAALVDGRLADLEGVQAAVRMEGVVALFDGKVLDTAAVFQPAPAVGNGYFEAIDRPIVREGRLPDQRRPDEMFANPGGARSTGLKIGDTFDLTVVSAEELQPEALRGAAGELSPEQQIEQLVADGMLGHHTQMRLVGIGVSAADVVPGGELEALFLTEGFVEQEHAAPVFAGIAVRLTAGTDGVLSFINDVRGLVPPGTRIDFQTLASDRDTVHRAVTPQVIALAVLAAVLAVGTVLDVGQALGRRVAEDFDDDAILSCLGMTASDRRLVDWLRLGSVSVVGTVVAIVVATLLSPAMPMGLARDFEPSPGLSFDTVALLVGGAVLATSAFSAGALFSVVARLAGVLDSAPSSLARWVRSRTAAVPLSFGVSLAIEPGRGRSSVPTRSTLATACVAVAALLASLTFAASLDRLVSNPREYGSDFDALVQSQDVEGREREALASMSTLLDESPDVEAWSRLYTEQVALPHGVTAVNAVGFERSDTASPTLVRGRFPTGAKEIALGALTMRREGVAIGAQIEVERQTGGQLIPFVVVGQVVLPGVASYRASDQAALGLGAMLSLQGLAEVTGVEAYGDPEASNTLPTAVLVTLRDGATPADLQLELTAAAGPGSFTVDGPLQSSDIASLERVRTTPLLLASLLGVVAAAAVGHALLVATRRRQRDLVLLRAIGLTPGQVLRTVAWQATTVAVAATLIGFPVGVIAGRVAWGSVCSQLGVVNHPATPTVAILCALPLAVVFANVASVVPGWRAARVRAADILRAPG